MVAFETNSREELENELLAILLNKNKTMELLQIKPQYLKSPKAKKMLEIFIDNFNKNKVIMPSEIIDELDESNTDYFLKLLENTFYYESNWLSQFEVVQNNLIKFYKEDIINQLNIDLSSNKINYDAFIKRVKELDAIQIQKDTKELTASEILACINEKKSRINLTNFWKLNNTLKLVHGDFLVIGGLTGSGKSGLMLNMLANLMNDYQCIYFNMEMSKPTIYKRIIAILSELRVCDVENPQTQHQRNLITNTLSYIESSKVVFEHKANNIQAIKSEIIRTKDKNRHTIIFLDHIGLIKTESAKTIYEQMTSIAKELRQICLEYDCTIIASSQMNRAAYNADELTLSMLKDTGELENSASKVILLYRKYEETKECLQQEMIIDVAKNRDGYTGLINVIYDKEKQIFQEEKEKYK